MSSTSDVEDLPYISALAASEQLIDDLLHPDYWRRLCPFLTVERNQPLSPPTQPLTTSEATVLKQEFIENGFFRLNQANVDEPDTCAKMARGIKRLLLHGWPASFIFMYDEPWAVIEKMQSSLSDISGGSRFVGDIFAWHVNPNHGQRGWGPHRDRMGSGPESFRLDGTPMLSTSWLALTDATPDNSCLHVIPAFEDPWYHRQDRPDVDPLASVFQGNPEAYQSIRCLSCPAGALWHFSHRIIHWGSYARTTAPPRIALSWVVGDQTFEEAAFGAKHLPFPDTALRMGFVSGQQIAYGGQTALKKGKRDFFHRVFLRQAERFSAGFRDKVEYIYYCRPAPAAIQLKASTKQSLKVKRTEINPSTLVMPTKEDEEKLNGIKGMFGNSSSSESESEESPSHADA